MGFRTNIVCVCSSKPNKITTFTTFWHPHGSAHLCTSARRSSFWPSSKKSSQMEQPRSPVGSTPKSTFKNKNLGLQLARCLRKHQDPPASTTPQRGRRLRKHLSPAHPIFGMPGTFLLTSWCVTKIFMLDTPILGNPWESCFL